MHTYIYSFKRRFFTSPNLFARTFLILVGSIFFFSITPVTAQSPTFSLKATPTSGQTPLIVNFETIMEQRWDYNGDGKIDDTITSTSDPVTFVYTNPGTYNPTVSVKQNNSIITSDSVTINVTASPDPTPTPTPAPTATPDPEPSGPAFYISPTGSNSNPGTLDKPWKTFNYAIPQLLPGDTLILKNGTYTKTTTGLPYINCASNANKGLVGSPITIKAENERQALLKSDGSAASLFMIYCSYWDVLGLTGQSADLPSSSGGKQYSVFQIANSNNITLKRLLATHNNRYFNTHTISIAYSSNILIEESEVYYFHRHGVSLFRNHNITVRRSYVNSRGHEDLSGGYLSRIKTRGDEGIVCYSSDGCIIENSISEGNDQILYGRNGEGHPPNMVLGTISINELAGISQATVSTSPDDYSDGCIIENSITINGNLGGMLKGVEDGIVENVTFYNNSSNGLHANRHGSVDIPNEGFTATNVLSFNNLAEFAVDTSVYGSNWLIEYSNAGDGGYFPPGESISDVAGSIRKSMKVAPEGMGLGNRQCIVYVPGGSDGLSTNPGSSNMAGAGKGGADIGANIVHRYVDGVLTDEKLWNQTTGQFPCGATVLGLNDDPAGETIETEACINVHRTLNVGVNGCPIP